MHSQQAPAVSGRGRKAIKTALKLAVSALLVAAIIWKVPVGQALGGLGALRVGTLALVVLLTLLFPVIAALRWQRALHWTGARQRWSLLFADVLVSSTYNMLLPTNIGGDVVRALRCARRLQEPHHAWSSTIFERLIGVVALVLLAVPGLLMAPGQVRELGVAVGAVAALAIAISLGAHAPFRVASKLLVSRAPSMAGAGDRIAADLSGPLSTLRARLEMLAWSTLYQVIGLGILVVVVIDWGQPQMTWAILGAIPLALVLTLLPVSIAGLGVRESLFVVLLGRFGVDAQRALSLAVVWLASSLLSALVGAAVLAAESSRGGAPVMRGQAAPPPDGGQ